jgi:hypothetical protein
MPAGAVTNRRKRTLWLTFVSHKQTSSNVPTLYGSNWSAA